MLGRCDLQQILHCLSSKNEYKFIEDFARVSITNHVLRHDHTEFLKNIKNFDEKTIKRLVDKLPFWEASMFQKDIFENNYDVLFYSVLMDYSQILFEEKVTGVKINNFSSILNKVEDTRYQSDIINDYKARRIFDIDKIFLDIFKNEFKYVGYLTINEFKENLGWLRKNISQPIIFINGAEIPGVDDPLVENIFERYCSLNKVLDEFIANNQNTYLLDVRKFVKTQEHYTNSIRHYTRPVYSMLAEELDFLLKQIALSGKTS